MSGHPIRITVADDLRRGHGSVFFRWWLAVPLLIWLFVWALAVPFVAVLNWILILLDGRSSASLHGFLSRFVRFTIHAYAYLNLAAEPFPGFDGKPGYPIDLEIAPPGQRNRWSVAFRIVLAVPAMLLAGGLAGSSSEWLVWRAGVNLPSLLVTCAFLGWFVGVILGRMPRGLRDALAYALSYGAQLWSYLLLLTDRYPDSDPFVALPELPAPAVPVALTREAELRRSRLTVFFRLLLALPHLVWLTLWTLLALVAAVANWAATLLTSRPPQPLHRFLSAYLRCLTHVGAYLMLVANPFPGFVGEPGYPIDALLEPAKAQHRGKTLFRLPLALPALMLCGVYWYLLTIAAFLGWFAALFTAKMPLGLRNLGVLALGYLVQSCAYLLALSDTYPYSGPTAPHATAPVLPDAGVSG